MEDRSVLLSIRQGGYLAAEVPYVLDVRSGKYYEAAEENRPGEEPHPIIRDGIAKVYVP